jgi:hypothetical protein
LELAGLPGPWTVIVFAAGSRVAVKRLWPELSNRATRLLGVVDVVTFTGGGSAGRARSRPATIAEPATTTMAMATTAAVMLRRIRIFRRANAIAA